MLTLQYIPYSEIESLTSEGKIRKILSSVKNYRVVLLEGRLTPAEETQLIERTMEQITKTFKGIEICTIYPQEKKNSQLFSMIRKELIKTLLGHREGITIIGPATVIREIRRDPNKIELLTRNGNGRTRRRR